MTETMTSFKQPDKYIRDRILESIASLFHGATYSFFILKVRSSNADFNVSFSEATCKVTDCPGDLYLYGSLFQLGIKKLFRFLSKNDVNLSKKEKQAYECLFNVFSNVSRISTFLQRAEKNKSTFVLQLAMHLLEPLSKKYYVMDCDQEQYDSCKCCGEERTGSYGDTSMGNEDVWHGCLDILMRTPNQRPDISISVDASDSDDEGEDSSVTSSIEVKGHQSFNSYRSKILAETVVFAFLQKKILSDSESFLIPKIAISKKFVQIFFYDAEFDILIECAPFHLFSGTEIPYVTILAIWLALNYSLTCSGLTDLVLDRGFRADFLKYLSDDIKNIYQEKLKFGDCKSKLSTDESEIYKRIEGKFLHYETGKPKRIKTFLEDEEMSEFSKIFKKMKQ